MTKSEMKATFALAVKNDDKETLLKMLSPLIEKLSKMIIAGVLIKNVKLHLCNNGITGKASEMVAEMAQVRADNFMHYAAK
jgi:hypothetical protein